MNTEEWITHTLEPFCPEDARVLILGTLPSPKSRETGFYYGHPQNRFWRVLAAVFKDGAPESNEDKKVFLTRHHVALWDVLAACNITGASDSSIKNAQYNDLPGLMVGTPIAAIYTTGKKAGALYEKRWGDLPVPHVNLPSTSPANCRMHLDELVDAYAVIPKSMDL